MHANSQTLQLFLERKGIAAEIIFLEQATLTVADAADAVGVASDQIVKSVLFLADGAPVLVISCGTARIAWKQLADYLGVSRKRLKMGKADQVLANTGYVVGAVPPFGHPRPLRTIIETAVLQQQVIYGGGGEINALMRIATTELQRVLGAETAELAERKTFDE